jgi:hypothetical protein
MRDRATKRNPIFAKRGHPSLTQGSRLSQSQWIHSHSSFHFDLVLVPILIPQSEWGWSLPRLVTFSVLIASQRREIVLRVESTYPYQAFSSRSFLSVTWLSLRSLSIDHWKLGDVPLFNSLEDIQLGFSRQLTHIHRRPLFMDSFWILQGTSGLYVTMNLPLVFWILCGSLSISPQFEISTFKHYSCQSFLNPHVRILS